MKFLNSKSNTESNLKQAEINLIKISWNILNARNLTELGISLMTR